MPEHPLRSDDVNATFAAQDAGDPDLMLDIESTFGYLHIEISTAEGKRSGVTLRPSTVRALHTWLEKRLHA